VGFATLQEAKEYVDGIPEDNVIFTAHGDEIRFSLIKGIVTDIERNPWWSPFGTEQLERIRWQPLLLSATGVKYITVRGPVDTSFKEGEVISPRELMPSTSIPREELRRIADKYGWWASRQAEALCPHSDVACVERGKKVA
jgi:hypothetical protein